MIRRLLACLALVPLAACASAPKKPAPSTLESRDPYTYHVAVQSVPEDVSQLVVTVEIADPTLRPVSVHGLVGNAPFDVPLSSARCSFTNEQVSLSLEPIGESASRLQVSTHGKPVELGLCLTLPKESKEVGTLEGALARGTKASGGNPPIEAVTRLERSR